MLKVLKEAAGEALDEVASKSLEVHDLMEKAGASKEEIEEMMAMMMSKGGGISKDFISSITQAMESGGGENSEALFFPAFLHNVFGLLGFVGSPSEILELLKEAMEEEMDSVTNCLRNTFLNKVPTEEDLKNTCRTLAEKLTGNDATRSDAKLALMDVLDEVLQGMDEILIFFELSVIAFRLAHLS